MKVLIPLASQQKGFFISLGRQLAELGHTVRFAPRDQDVATLIRRLAPQLADDMMVAEDFSADVSQSDVVGRALQVEEHYGVHLAMLLSYDRALGRGYLFNADRYPRIRRACWGYKQKLAYILRRFEYAELLLEHYRPDVIIAIQKDEVLNAVAGARGVRYLSPAPVKLGSRFMWSDDLYLTDTDFLQALRENVTKSLEQLPPPGEYSQEAGSKFNHALLRYTWRGTLPDLGRNVTNELKAFVRGSRKKDSYPLFGWVPNILRRPRNYRLFLRYGLRPNQLAGRRSVYVPLHLEPEIALLALSPEFNNSMEMIAWISKSLPADAFVVVKEQPFSFGVRSKRYYHQLLQIGNVVLAHPETSSWEWICATTVTATITGTAATEAVVFGRPVLSFGRHQAVNLLPTVRLATEYESTKAGLDDLLRLDPQDPVFELSRRALYWAQVSSSFDLPGFERIYKSEDLHQDLARKALDGLVHACPGLATSAPKT